jgi:NAD(P)H-dependent FMN reductase
MTDHPNVPAKILAFAGSTRSGSFNKKLIKLGAEAARAAGAEVTLIDLRDLPMPLYDGDLEDKDGLPPNAVALKKLFMEHRGLLLSCPEYNSSISGVLKNTIDWLSRQDPKNPNEKPLACFSGKIVSLLSASPGALGGLRGLVTVRSILGNIQVIVLPEQLAVSKAHEAFDENGRLKDAKQQAVVERIAKTLVETVKKLA